MKLTIEMDLDDVNVFTDHPSNRGEAAGAILERLADLLYIDGGAAGAHGTLEEWGGVTVGKWEIK